MKKSLKVNFYLVFAGMGLLISLGICTMMYFQFSSNNRATYFSTLANVAVMVEKQYPILYDIDKLKEGSQNDEDWFWETSRELGIIAESFNIAYIYYIERVERDKYIFLMSSYVSRNFHPEWLLGPVWIETPTPQGVDEAWDSQVITFSPHPSYEEEWGILVSALLPIVKDGRTIGLLGVDYDISVVEELQQRVLFYLFISFSVSVILTGLLAFWGSHSVVVPIEERERMVHEAAEHNKKIEALMKHLKSSMISKSAFMVSISNEISLPINEIIRLSSMMMQSKDMTEEQKKNLMSISDSAATLLNVSNDILEINKIDAGQFKIRPVEYELPNLIHDTTILFADNAEHSKVPLKINLSNRLPLKLYGDDLHIKQVCNRLLLNAFKYTSEGSVTFDVSFERDKEHAWLLVIKVSDTGVGIAKKDISTVFTGYGADVASKLQSGSTGLGIAIIKQIIKMMSGTISVDSVPGKGTTFTLRIRQKVLSAEKIDAQTLEQLKNFKYVKKKNA